MFHFEQYDLRTKDLSGSDTEQQVSAPMQTVVRVYPAHVTNGIPRGMHTGVTLPTGTNLVHVQDQLQRPVLNNRHITMPNLYSNRPKYQTNGGVPKTNQYNVASTSINQSNRETGGIDREAWRVIIREILQEILNL